MGMRVHGISVVPVEMCVNAVVMIISLVSTMVMVMPARHRLVPRLRLLDIWSAGGILDALPLKLVPSLPRSQGTLSDAGDRCVDFLGSLFFVDHFLPLPFLSEFLIWLLKAIAVASSSRSEVSAWL